MKKFFTPILMLFVSLQLFSQGTFQKLYDIGGGDDYSNKVVKALSGTPKIFVCGSTNKVGAGGYDAHITAFDTTGSVLWQRQFGGAGTEFGTTMVIDSTGIFLVGRSNSFATGGNQDAMLARVKLDGTYDGGLTLGFDSTVEVATDITLLPDGGMLIAGETTANDSAGHKNMFLVRLTNEVSPVFMKTFGAVNRNESAMICGSIPDFGYYVAGTSDAGSAGADDGYLAVLDDSGRLQGQLLIGGTGADGIRGILPTDNKTLIIAGNTFSRSGGNGDIFVGELDLNSITFKWLKTYGGSSNDGFTSISPAVGGGYNVTGSTGNLGVLFKIDTSGNVIKANTWGGGSGDAIQYNMPLDDGSIVVTGYTYSFAGAGANSNIFLARTTDGTFCSNGNTVTFPSNDITFTIAGPDLTSGQVDSVVAFDETFRDFASNSYTLTTTNQCPLTAIRNTTQIERNISVYPNPTDGVLTVKSNNTWNTTVNVTVYNTIGSVVITKTIPANTSEFLLDITGQPSGMYIVTFNDGKTIATEKINLK